jgi:hypothetical protein
MSLKFFRSSLLLATVFFALTIFLYATLDTCTPVTLDTGSPVTLVFRTPEGDHEPQTPDSADRRYTRDYQLELIARADCGDWKAAEELGVVRANLRIFDRLTLRLVRIWSEHDDAGLVYLHLVLIRSCKLEERLAGMDALRKFLKTKVFESRGESTRASFESEYKRGMLWVNNPPPKCVTY